jgi:hypothetical protein
VAFALGSRKIHLPGPCIRSLRSTGRVPEIQKINLPANKSKCGLRRITRHDFVWEPRVPESTVAPLKKNAPALNVDEHPDI